MEILKFIVSYIIPILSFLGIGSLFACYLKEVHDARKEDKRIADEQRLKNIIHKELEPIVKDVKEIKEEELKLKKSTTTLIRAHIDNLYNKAMSGNKDATKELLNIKNDPIYINDDEDEVSKEKVNSIKGYYGIYNKSNTIPAANARPNKNSNKRR